MCNSTCRCECKFFIWLVVLSRFLLGAFVLRCKAAFHGLHVRVRFICERQLVAECGECSMKSINPPPAEVQYVCLADGDFIQCMQIVCRRHNKFSAELFSPLSVPSKLDTATNQSVYAALSQCIVGWCGQASRPPGVTLPAGHHHHHSPLEKLYVAWCLQCEQLLPEALYSPV